MKIFADEAFERFTAAAEADDLGGERVKKVRHRVLKPGGRTEVTLFERVGGGGRAHPRFRTAMPPATDPAPPGGLFPEPDAAPRTAADFETALRTALETTWEQQAGADLDPGAAPEGSERYWRNSIRAQRTARFFAEARERLDGWIADGTLPEAEVAAARYALRVVEDEAYAGVVEFDDADTGTYHSFGHDAPFVHYLEAILESLPEPGSAAFALLPPVQQAAIRRQRAQAQSHLDHLMRHKYAYHVIEETDIERTLGGRLIDRRTREIASEVEAARDSLQPRYELLRIRPGADHPHAGAWVYRDGEGGLRLRDGTPVEVDPEQVRSIPVEADALTFERAPEDERLRKGLRFDWDGNGYVQPGRIDWVSWAGHCDIKAILEQLGVTLSDDPRLTEYRSDTDAIRTYDRDLLLEMVASVLELGSVYAVADGSGVIQRGVHRFGGARNDSRPDRLQFKGAEPGRGFRWPLVGRQDAFVVENIHWPDGPADMKTAFLRHLPDAETLDFAPNPRYLGTTEGDYNIVDVSGARLDVRLRCQTIDPETGYLREERREIEIDLGPDGEGKRYDLGTHVEDAAARRLWRVTLDREQNAIVAEMDEYARVDGRWAPRRLPEKTVVLPLAAPLTATLSREMKLDDPRAFQTLLSIAMRQGQNICADTDMTHPVWNGLVTRIAAKKEGENRAARVERWRVDIEARFGRATLDFLMRRDAEGEPVAYCPVPAEHGRDRAPDFLWQDFPDVGSKGVEGGDWIVNRTMWDRGIVSVEVEPDAPGGFYVHDDHVKNVYEMIYCALGGLPWTVVHGNKRYGFADEATWRAAVERLKKLRSALRLAGEDGRPLEPLATEVTVN